MSDQDTTPGIAPEAPRRVVGRPWAPGTSGNPGGFNKRVARARKALEKHAERAAAVLAEILESGSNDERVAAAKVILTFTVPKPKPAQPGEDLSKRPGAALPLRIVEQLASMKVQ